MLSAELKKSRKVKNLLIGGRWLNLTVRNQAQQIPFGDLPTIRSLSSDDHETQKFYHRLYCAKYHDVEISYQDTATINP